MAILAGLSVISIFAALLWLSQHRTSLHIAIFSALIPAAFLFGHGFGLSAGFLIAIGVMVVEMVLIPKQAPRHQIS